MSSDHEIPKPIIPNPIIPKPLVRLYKAMHYSLAGLRSAYQHERAFREETWLLIVLVPLAVWLGDNAIEYSLLIGSWIIVMIAELFNTAIEATIDRIGAEYHELSGRAKDVGSAAVMVSIILSAALWITITVG